MKLLPTSLLLYLNVLLLSSSALPLTQRSAPFPSLIGLTPLTHDFNRPDNNPSSTKFFHESTFSAHYDGRFAAEALGHSTRIVHLRLMLRAYTVTMARIGVRTWLMHGGLLGWWWGGRLMPWDTDLDYMVDEGGMETLGGWWNMSVHEFTASDFGIRKKKYLLEVNPCHTNTSTKDRSNKIDARWIDTSTGLFIDITTLHTQPYSTIKPPKKSSHHHPTPKHRPVADDDDDNPDDPDIPLYTKDSHAYSSSQLFPLRLTTFEDTLTLVPNDYESVLLDEYGSNSITQPWFRGWKFEKAEGGWVQDEENGGAWDKEGKGKGKEKGGG
ncbi:hypothetical protein IQ06DRAFT_234926 [Phaeosphaeriaceae sp. SRC1lsM3a]|nr:hypothetical protein IQ06DRAFT_234926 [Stagonospora sp. SRC1lsM3a]